MIKRDLPSKRSNVYEYQAQFLAQTIRKLEEATRRNFSERSCDELSIQECWRFRAMPEAEEFMQAALVSGFVCSDINSSGSDFTLALVHQRPSEVVPNLSFSKLRQYVHLLQRTVKWNSEYPIALFKAVTSGALGLVASRLESDESLREPLFSELDDAESEIVEG